MAVTAFPLRIPALSVNQPLGEFFVVCMSAETLLQITYSDPLRVERAPKGVMGYGLRGAQREESDQRLREIARYIDTSEAAFPNSIILGANYSEDGQLIDEESPLRWKVARDKNKKALTLVIPTAAKLAAIIDGQHRLHAFEFASEARAEMPLLCVVYLDLPNPYQAYLFATINFNQKKVDRSLAYELFGFNVEDEPPDSWSPEKSAVFLCRRLNVDKESPFVGHIIVAALDDDSVIGGAGSLDVWKVSTATVVDGILRLISSNPKRDKDLMHQKSIGAGRSRSLLQDDGRPLRLLYLAENDLAIYTALKNFFVAVKEELWNDVPVGSYIRKNVGIQALFDVLRALVADFRVEKKISLQFFKSKLSPVKRIDFANGFFQASGKGRVRIKNSMLLAMGLVELDGLPQLDAQGYQEVTQ
jgi:DNA phosphorothioation-associated DGQHR protein 1